MTKIFAHRGSSGSHPENTIVAFKEAERAGADGIEIDVNMTKDNELVVIHDQTVDRTTNSKGRVIDFTLEEVQKFDAGSWFSEEFTEERIPTLKEVLHLVQDNKLLLNIELKNVGIHYPQIEEKMIKEIEDYDLEDQVIISSFNHYSLKKINELNPKLECAILSFDMLYEPWDYAKRIGAKSLHPHVPKTSDELMIGAMHNGFPIRVFTVNRAADMKKFMGKGCSIITDYPEKALKIRDSMS